MTIPKGPVQWHHGIVPRPLEDTYRRWDRTLADDMRDHPTPPDPKPHVHFHQHDDLPRHAHEHTHLTGDKHPHSTLA